MGFFDFLGGGLNKVIDSVSGLIDNLSTTDEEKAKLKNELAKEMNGFKISVMEAQNEYEKELTKRLQADMASDSWLSKNIRPLTLTFILTMFTILSLTNGFGLEYDPAYIELLETWGNLALIFYFGSRGFEKITKIKNKNKFGDE